LEHVTHTQTHERTYASIHPSFPCTMPKAVRALLFCLPSSSSFILSCRCSRSTITDSFLPFYLHVKTVCLPCFLFDHPLVDHLDRRILLQASQSEDQSVRPSICLTILLLLFFQNLKILSSILLSFVCGSSGLLFFLLPSQAQIVTALASFFFSVVRR